MERYGSAHLCPTKRLEGVEIAGITPHPTAAFVQQCARQLTTHFDGFLLHKRYLIPDRDTKFTEAFDTLLRDS